jgi:hypothetical protein
VSNASEVISSDSLRTDPPQTLKLNHKPQPNLQSINSALELLLEPGSTAELRILNTECGTVSGYYRQPKKLAEAAYQWDSAPGIYVTLNPVNPDLYARAADRTQTFAKNTTSDRDIACRRWLPIDFDPVRPSGISSTAAEHDAALERAKSCRDYLQACGWPEPIFANSGNGAHLLYRVDLPNDEASTALVKNCLGALALRFSDETVGVDVANSNPARIWKLYGTVARKGHSTEERPHRISKVLDAPATLQCVTKQQLEQLVRSNQPQREAATARSRNRKFDLQAWIEERDLSVVREGDWQGGYKWILNPCPWNPDHTNSSAYIIQLPNGAISAGCHHNGCAEHNWHSLKALFGGTSNTKEGASEKPLRQSQADQLMHFAEDAEFFHTQSGDTYASIPVGDHRENWPVNSKSFREWLQRQSWKEMESTVSTQALNEVVNTCSARAKFDGPELPVFTRIAQLEGKMYLDLCDKDWTTVEIDATGWRIVASPPVKFQRTYGMKELPRPVLGGSVDELRKFINIGSEANWRLVAGWLLAALRSEGPFPILVLHGEQGSAKSTLAKMLRALVDPNRAELRSEPRGIQDVMIAAKNGWIISLDNLSSLPVWLSDSLCRISTGGGFGTRQLYSDTEEILIDVQRPSILNGIEELAVRGDLLDRSLVLYLPSIPETARRSELELWAAFQDAQPRILGALLTAVSGAMAALPKTHLKSKPRLADFAMWATAAESSLGWDGGAFMEAYDTNRAAANDLALEASPVAQAIQQCCPHGWTGTATDLLNWLNQNTAEETLRQKNWPSNATALSGALRRLTPNLRKAGITIEFTRDAGHGRKRLIKVSVKPMPEELDTAA